MVQAASTGSQLSLGPLEGDGLGVGVGNERNQGESQSEDAGNDSHLCVRRRAWEKEWNFLSG